MLRRAIATLWLVSGIALMAVFGMAGSWAYPLGRDIVWAVAAAGMAAWVLADLPLLVTAFRRVRHG